MNRMSARGFTLLELMITVVVVGILAAIAYPSYTSHVAKSRRAEAQSELMRLATLLEQYRIDHKTYTTDLTKVGASASSYTVAKNAFTIAVASASRDKLTLRATAATGQMKLDPGCATLTINEVGLKSATKKGGGASDACW